jgi:hypothetical protein
MNRGLVRHRPTSAPPNCVSDEEEQQKMNRGVVPSRPASAPPNCVSDEEEQQPVATDAAAQPSRKARKTTAISPKRLLLLVGVLSCTIYALLRGYNALKLAIKDPFTNALLLPHRYLSIQFWQDPPSQIQRTFQITTDNAFVINLEQDTDRWERFLDINAKSSSVKLFQTFPAFVWTAEKDIDQKHQQQQDLLEEHYC